MGELDGKVAIVTGAGRMRGIGRAAANALAKAGANVVVTGTGRDPATFPADEKAAHWGDIDSVAKEVRAHGRKALPLVSNANDPVQVQAVIDRTAREFGRIDILINNAAAALGADRVPVVDLSDELFRKVVEVKLFGTFYYRGRQVHDQAEPGRPDREHLVNRGQARRREHGRLQRGELCGRGLHAGAGQRVGRVQDHRQLGLPGTYRHLTDGQHQGGGELGEAGSRHPDG